jgi:hypothetical protein
VSDLHVQAGPAEKPDLTAPSSDGQKVLEAKIEDRGFESPQGLLGILLAVLLFLT